MQPISPLVSLATQISSQPGVFAALLGSGVSTGAGLPTGWQVVKELVGRAAVALDPASPTPTTDSQVDEWWSQHGSGEIGYSTVLEALAPTQGGRQALLERFFEANAGSSSGDEDSDEEALEPSTAHRALAKMVQRGDVKVILTTNFDRLMEQALQEVGVQPQVITRPEALAGMKPLAHAKATVIKLHGDYKDLTTLNTPAELGDYADGWKVLLAQVLTEYGLVVAGWSGDWDMALVRAVESNTSHLYPMYWDGRSGRGETAQRILAARSGIVIPCGSADELFSELNESLLALERIAQAPITTSIAKTRLKRYLLNPVHRIDAYDLVISAIGPIGEAIEQVGSGPISSIDIYEQLLDDYARVTSPLLELILTGVRHDEEGINNRLWLEVIERLIVLRRPPDGTFNELVWKAQHYPALLAFYTVGCASIVARNETLFIQAGRDLSWTSPFNSPAAEPAAHVLRADRVLGWDAVNDFTAWQGTKWQQPPSHLLRHHLSPILSALPVDGDVRKLLDDVEYRHAVLIHNVAGGGGPLTGEYRGDQNWGDSRAGEIGKRFRSSADRYGSDWPWWSIVGEDLNANLQALEKSVSWHGGGY